MITGPMIGVPFSVAIELAEWLRQEMNEATARGDRVFSKEARQMMTEFQAVLDHVVANVVAEPAKSTSTDTLEEVSTTEAAKRLGISRQAVLGRIRRGTLPARVAGQYWINVQDLQEREAS